MTMTLSHFHARAHTHLSVHAIAHFSLFFFVEGMGWGGKNTLDYSGTMGEGRSPQQQAERGRSRLFMWSGMVSEELIFGVTRRRMAQLLFLIS